MTTKMINATSELTNVSDILMNNYDNDDAVDNVLANMHFDDLRNIDELLNLLNSIDMRYRSDDVSIFDAGLQVERIGKDSNVYGWLKQYYNHNHMRFSDHISGFYETDDAIYFTHGFGYNVVDADLLGGIGDGTKEFAFYKYIND